MHSEYNPKIKRKRTNHWPSSIRNSLHFFFNECEFLISKGISFQSFELDTDIDFCPAVRLVLSIKSLL